MVGGREGERKGEGKKREGNGGRGPAERERPVQSHGEWEMGRKGEHSPLASWRQFRRSDSRQATCLLPTPFPFRTFYVLCHLGVLELTLPPLVPFPPHPHLLGTDF